MTSRSRTPGLLAERLNTAARIPLERLDLSWSRWHDWVHEGYRTGGQGRRSKGSVPDLGDVLAVMEHDHVDIAHEGQALMRRLLVDLDRLAQLVTRSVVSDPGDIRAESNLPTGAGTCQGCGVWCRGDRDSGERLVEGLCLASCYHACRRARTDAGAGWDRGAWIAKRRSDKGLVGQHPAP